ncbi:MAG: flagellar export chaperone FliS [Bacillota bacterium]|jgi:flagellar protein FliS
MVGNPYQQYQQNAVSSAAPAQLTMMLYNGAIKFARQGVVAIEAAEIEEAHKAIMRVQDIINYLSATLNPAYDVAGNLAALYDYMVYRLLQANLKKDAVLVQEVIAMLEELRDTWEQAVL